MWYRLRPFCFCSCCTLLAVPLCRCCGKSETAAPPFLGLLQLPSRHTKHLKQGEDPWMPRSDGRLGPSLLLRIGALTRKSVTPIGLGCFRPPLGHFVPTNMAFPANSDRFAPIDLSHRTGPALSSVDRHNMAKVWAKVWMDTL